MQMEVKLVQVLRFESVMLEKITERKYATWLAMSNAIQIKPDLCC